VPGSPGVAGLEPGHVARVAGHVEEAHVLHGGVHSDARDGQAAGRGDDGAHHPVSRVGERWLHGREDRAQAAGLEPTGHVQRRHRAVEGGRAVHVQVDPRQSAGKVNGTDGGARGDQSAAATRLDRDVAAARGSHPGLSSARRWGAPRQGDQPGPRHARHHGPGADHTARGRHARRDRHGARRPCWRCHGAFLRRSRRGRPGPGGGAVRRRGPWRNHREPPTTAIPERLMKVTVLVAAWTLAIRLI
jgi:hypothetical protein